MKLLIKKDKLGVRQIKICSSKPAGRREKVIVSTRELLANTPMKKVRSMVLTSSHLVVIGTAGDKTVNDDCPAGPQATEDPAAHAGLVGIQPPSNERQRVGLQAHH